MDGFGVGKATFVSKEPGERFMHSLEVSYATNDELRGVAVFIGFEVIKNLFGNAYLFGEISSIQLLPLCGEWEE